ncbi:short-subunit dehydrogenase [Labedella gwakjiensis]|nr:short-subunit dehydrogenase [Labedella gwakjiensis]
MRRAAKSGVSGPLCGVEHVGESCSLPVAVSSPDARQNRMMDAHAEFAGRIALVTGAGRGIGRAIAEGLAARGAHVAIVARSGDDLDRVVAGIVAAGGRATAFARDLLDDAERDSLIDDVEAECGRVDVLINNAAIVDPLGRSVDVPMDAFERALRLNVVAPAALSFRVLPGMVAAGWGRIVNVSSGVAVRNEAMIGANAYTTTKAALEAHTRNLAAEYADSGVTINVYRPGVVDTGMQEWLRSRPEDEVATGLPANFRRLHEEGALITPERSAAGLLARLSLSETGQDWSV